ncbi:uncharacterized protein JN550_013306 [Neoarthrinium moseri]|uniref:uncharacterized protein n=1 Tax=Neoarthrinium moseri TaxID=1658444 RepID=UPI001FDD7E34|nr:uncharacterized protein JN550_013306 [Neoarthrinium moseri]KAI1857326.1 hypothetical protein JN550_013306 [Neoarthrinium moseri]
MKNFSSILLSLSRKSCFTAMATPKKLKVAVLGPSGQCGQSVVNELLSRNHDVVGLSRNPPKTWTSTTNTGSYTAESVDVFDDSSLARAFSKGYDAIVCSYAPPLGDFSKLYQLGVEGHAKIKTALLASDHKGPFVVIGGAGSLHCADRRQLVDQPDFAFGWWYTWPSQHVEYMRVRASDHGASFFSRFIGGFAWARQTVEKTGLLSTVLRPFARLYLRWAKKFLTSNETISLITQSRIALRLWQGVTEKPWTFLSPPGQLRDKGVRTGQYRVYVDTAEDPAVEATERGIYNEDMAVAIVDEVEKNQLNWKHWTCTGPIDLGRW